MASQILTVRGVKGTPIEKDKHLSGCNKHTKSCDAWGQYKLGTRTYGYKYTQTSPYKENGCSGHFEKTHYHRTCKLPTPTCKGTSSRVGTSRGWMLGNNEAYATNMGGGIYCEYDTKGWNAKDISDLNDCVSPSQKGARFCAFAGKQIDDPKKYFDSNEVRKVLMDFCMSHTPSDPTMNGICPLNKAGCDGDACQPASSCFNYMKTHSDDPMKPSGASACANFLNDPENEHAIEQIMLAHCKKPENIASFECDCLSASDPQGRLNKTYSDIMKSGVQMPSEQCWFLPCRNNNTGRILLPSKTKVDASTCPPVQCQNILLAEGNTDLDKDNLQQNIDCHPETTLVKADPTAATTTTTPDPTSNMTPDPMDVDGHGDEADAAEKTPPATAPPATTPPAKETSSLSTGAIVGIGIAIFLFIAMIAYLILAKKSE